MSNLSHPSLPPPEPAASSCLNVSTVSGVSSPPEPAASSCLSVSTVSSSVSRRCHRAWVKSRSCLTASGIGGRVSLALGSALPRGTGRACFSRVSLPSVPHTGAASCAPHWLGPGRPLLQPLLPAPRQGVVMFELLCIILIHSERSGWLFFHIFRGCVHGLVRPGVRPVSPAPRGLSMRPHRAPPFPPGRASGFGLFYLPLPWRFDPRDPSCGAPPARVAPPAGH